ncbi:hypothetical protein [Priestia megaterium]|uniref:hypothetical protein n=1 Tax=Priestia megaterium TaxID=1404 RepID=UPI0009909FD4|nr:hypothetical protein [Priestia megaterium]AQU73781.1 hypothetical protein BUW91_10920 [Priestia megaterium]
MNVENIDIIESKVFGLYISELFSLVHVIKRECEEIFKETKEPATGYIMQVSPEIHSKINTVIINSANLKKLLYSPGDKKKKESTKKFKVRKQREALFKELILNLDLEEISNTNVRNKLEHFDEYLDDMTLKLIDEVSEFKKKYPAAVYNMIFSKWEAISPRAYPIRLYITAEKTFYHMDWSINLGKIYKEAKLILERLENSDLLPDEKPGGLIVKFQ